MTQKLDHQEIEYWVKLVATEFYERIYNDPWFKRIFRGTPQELITQQQIDFMVQSLGGVKNFCGRMPKEAHPHIWINDEIWDYRESLLMQVFVELDVPLELQSRWIKIDDAFKNVIINQAGPQECQKRFPSDEIIYEPMPQFKKNRAA